MKHPVLQLIVKLLVIAVITITCVVYTDRKGYFLTDQRTPHHERRWESIYRLTPKDTIDVVVLGNSHVNTGINPKNLSCALGCTAFAMAPSGTNIADSYFCLKEILTRTHPRLVIVETYLMNGTDKHNSSKGGVADQFRSFYPRRNIPIKLASMPVLFEVDNYLPAWSSTLRNHEMILRHPEEIKENQKILKSKRRHPDTSLYLGRFVRFTSGITDSIMTLYEAQGAPVDGATEHVGEQDIAYARKIVDLCEKNDIEVFFFTLPMYYRHVQNYDAWREEQARAIIPTGKPWLNLQEPYDPVLFNRECFEPTYAKNQHMTYYGSLIATYQLAHYIKDTLHIRLPERYKEERWNRLFYGQEGYFENYRPALADKNFTVFYRDTVVNSLRINDLTLSTDNTLMLKIPASEPAPPAIPLDVSVEFNGREESGRIMLSPGGFSLRNHIYTCRINPDVHIKNVKLPR